MTESKNQAQDALSDGMSKLMEATRANMTAYNLAAVGVAAIAAGTVAYMWDQSRRNMFFQNAHKMADQMREAWGLQMPQTATNEEEAEPVGHA